MPSKEPEVAYLEDESELGTVREGTRKEARRRQTTSGPPRSIYRYRVSRDGASDSGYSSQLSNTRDSNEATTGQAARDRAAMPPPSKPISVQTQVRSRPAVVHQDSRQQTRPQPPSRSNSISRPVEPCTDPSCSDPICVGAPIESRRHSGANQYAASGYVASPMQYQQYPPYHYAQIPPYTAGKTVVPQMAAQPPAPSRPASRQARPASIHGYSSLDAARVGQPSTNAGWPPHVYEAWRAQQFQQQQQQQMLQMQQLHYRQQQQQPQPTYQAAYGTTPPTQQAVPVYVPPSPLQASPTSPNYGTFSARTAAITTPTYDLPSVRHAAPLARAYSARQRSARTPTMPGAFPTDAQYSESESESDHSEMSEEEYQRSCRPRDSRLMSSPQRRPSMAKHYPSAPAVPTRSHEMLRRNSRSEYISTDNVDSDRTVQPAIERARTHYSTSTRSSRRPSQSTASSSRTKSTNLSSLNSGMANMVITDRNGRRREYLSKREQDAIDARERADAWKEEEYRQHRRESSAQRRRERAVEEYQNDMRGGPPPHLTAENIRITEEASSRRRESVSGRSQKTGRSGACKSRGAGEGVTIETGETTFHVYGDASVEVQPAEDGGLAKLRIGRGSGGGGERSQRDSAYYGSKSSSSRVGRSRAPSEAGRGRSEAVKGRRESASVKEEKTAT